MGESSIRLEKYKRLEKVFEFTQYFVVVLGLLIIQLPLPMEINKTGVYIVSFFVISLAFFWHRLLPQKYSGLNKNFIETLAGIISIAVIVNLTGGERSYFNFFYFLPVLSSGVYMPLRYSISLTTLTSALILLPIVGIIGTGALATSFSIAALQIWAVWLIAAYGRFLGGEINLAQKKQESIKLEEINEMEKLKDEFIFIVSHELRSPITAIRGYLEILTKEYSSSLNQKTKAVLQKAFSTSNKLSNLVTLLLEMARLETGNIHFFVQKVSIKDSLGRVLYNMEIDIEQKNIDMRVKIPPNLQAKIDQERLEEILSIIIENAVVYTPEFGRVDVVAKKAKENIEITVADNGVGISEERKERLFEKFYTEKTGVGHSTIKSINIGMYVVRELLSRMGGEIKVESKVGEGTKFTILLPSSRDVPVKAIVFDAGGVLFNSATSLFSEPINYVTRISGAPKEKVNKVYREVIKEYESHKVDKEGLWTEITEKLGVKLPYSGQDPIAYGFKKFKADKEVLALINKLKLNYKVALVSNANAVEASTPQAQSLYKEFDEVVLSFKIGERKPHPKIYTTVFDRLGVKSEESVFVDNTLENVEEAKALGMKGILFKNANQLKEDLKKVGVIVKV